MHGKSLDHIEAKLGNVTINNYNYTVITPVVKVKVKSPPPSGESTTTECVVNYQLLAVIAEVAQWETPICSRPQAATHNGVRDGRSN